MVLLDAINYHFKPEGADPRHVCEVTDNDHIQRFLSITEGYRIAEHTKDEPVVDKVKVAPIKESAPLAPAGGDEASDEGEVKADAPVSANETRDEAAARYQAKFGRKPHGKWDKERIVKELESV